LGVLARKAQLYAKAGTDNYGQPVYSQFPIPVELLMATTEKLVETQEKRTNKRVSLAYFPPGTSLAVGDRIVADGKTFQVTSVNARGGRVAGMVAAELEAAE
jgi:hypothetical protein